ncbi:hypothetical protein PFICI_12558 [Pestalotiopsis fici W106-1]|uniref:Uncharacterized protein n=1 Tax=Pestalotiopsis fici (strain W106-1 / CGMCC3.15140) TaxID=1229662 RepID=W3WP82_PESFW|nr:uncharacterized protein PFICI_12558 [Pestalotiopsis fici W106-1]ETS75614.1 hypothetical protein PFICI_12558 [Pestalotiopsis fici W106-1]
MKYTAVLSLLFAGVALADLPYQVPEMKAKRQDGIQPPPIWTGQHPTGTGGLHPPPPHGTGGFHHPPHGTGTYSLPDQPTTTTIPGNLGGQVRDHHHHQPTGTGGWVPPTGTGFYPPPGGAGPTGGFHGPPTTLRTEPVARTVAA